MSRVGLSVVVAAVAGVSLTGCSSALSSNSSSEQLQTLKFESDPLGAEVHTAQGQTCKTPCELTVPSHEQPVIITKDDYTQQTLHVTLGPQPDHPFWENPPPTLVPNPVRVVLQPVPKPVRHVGGHRSVSRTHTAKPGSAPSAAASRLTVLAPARRNNDLLGRSSERLPAPVLRNGSRVSPTPLITEIDKKIKISTYETRNGALPLCR